MLDKTYFPIAAKMARKGATHGMIVQRLRNEHLLNEPAANEIAKQAMTTADRHSRSRAAVFAVVGVLMIISGSVISLNWIEIKFGVALGFAGLIVCGIGTAQLFQRRQSR